MAFFKISTLFKNVFKLLIGYIYCYLHYKENFKNIDIDIFKFFLENVNRGCSHITAAKIRGSWTPPPPQYIDIDKQILEYIDIDKQILENIDIDKQILEHINFVKISYW